jgi:GDPmannose 4,6-dehydratase
MRKEKFVVSKKKALITGVTGQDGSYLSELLLQKGYEVHGLKRRSSSLNSQRIDHIYQDPHSLSRNFYLHYGDMTDSTNLIRLVAEIRPDEIYNLAAQSHVQVSFETAEYTANADALGATRLLEAIRILKLEKHTKFYQASTSEMFGISKGEILNEESNFYPRSPYGVAKLYAYWLTINYREAYKIFATNGILFNHESPRRGETFVTRKIIQGAVNIARGQLDKLYLGNLDAVRDWGHAKDFVDGMYKIMQYETPEDWVIATGYSISVRDFTSKVFEKIGLKLRWENSGVAEIGVDQSGKILVQVDPKYFRPTEVPHLKGDATKAKTKLGWVPNYNLEELINEMIKFELDSKNL